jgi:acetolactate decarboxylase
MEKYIMLNRQKILLFIALGIALWGTGCTTIAPTDTAFQTSTIDALLAGVYDGDMSCRQLLTHGDFGIGTFDHLDGEMVVLDGNLYQIKSDGKVYSPDMSTNTPFATVCKFVMDKTFTVGAGTNYKALEHLINQHVPNQNLFYAIKITGKFSQMKTRSVPGQKKPYPPLKTVTSHQPEFKMKNVSGTIVGFRCPPYVKGINVPGYHLHFISDDRTQGGHILSFKIITARCEIDILNNYFLTLPLNTKGFAETDLSKDRSKELKAVEK